MVTSELIDNIFTSQDIYKQHFSGHQLFDTWGFSDHYNIVT